MEVFKFEKFIEHIDESRKKGFLTPDERKEILDTMLKCETDEDGDDVEYYLVRDDYNNTYYLTNNEDEYDGPQQEIETYGTLKEIYDYIIRNYNNPLKVLKYINLGEIDYDEMYDDLLLDYHKLLNEPDFEQNKIDFEKSKYLVVISTYNYYMYVITKEMYETLDDNDYFIMCGFDDLQSLVLSMKDFESYDYKFSDYPHYKETFG